METNHLRARLDAGSPALGTLVLLEGAASARLLARSGYDFLVVDLQHAAFDLARFEILVESVAGTPCAIIARVHPGRSDQIEAALDAGAHGVMVPMVNTPADAQAAVDACRYPPRGRRSVGGTRNILARGPDYPARADDDVVCIIQIEHIEAVERIDAIVAVPGIDVVCPGHVDLARSMGHATDYSTGISNVVPTPVADAIDTVHAACTRKGIPLMPVVGDASEVAAAVEGGQTVVCVGSDFHLLRAATAASVAEASRLLARRDPVQDRP